MGGRGLRLRWVKPLLWREIRNFWVTKLIGTPFYRFFKVGVYPKILQIHWVLRIAREVRDALVLAKTKKKGKGGKPQLHYPKSCIYVADEKNMEWTKSENFGKKRGF